jgi:cadmium resistance protein CadD (predicted permease)
MGFAALSGLAVVAFASTDVDDIFLLVAFMADPHFRLRNVAIGQYLGIGVLVLASVAASLISLVLAPVHVGLLGVLPVLIGAMKLAALLRSGDGDEGERHETRGGSVGQIASVAAATIANGGDNIGVYTPLFATQTLAATALIAIVFLMMTGLWIGLAHWLVGHPKLGAPLRRYGHIAVPFVLIGLGLRILSEAGSLQWMRSVLASIF